MGVNLKGGFLFCALALSCIAQSAYSLPARSKTEDAKSLNAVLKPEEEVIKLEDSRQMELPAEEITNELEKMLVSMKKRETKEKETARASQQGPTNVVLVMSREPLAFGHNGTDQKRSTFALFPVKHYVQDKVKRSMDEPLLLVSPVLLPRRGSYGSTHSCQAALDDSISALLEAARSKRQMVTGYLASENLPFKDPLMTFWQKRSVSEEVSNTEPVPSVESGKHSIVKRSVEKEDDAEKKTDEGSSLIAPINDKFQKIGIEDKGTGILYKKVEIVGGSKTKSDDLPVKEGAEPVKGKVVKRQADPVEDEAESERKREESDKEGEESDKEGAESLKRSPSSKTTGTVAKAEKKVETDGASEAGNWDLFDVINRMRRSFLDHFLRGMGFDPRNQGNQEPAFSSPLVGLVDNTITDLQKESGDTGFMLVVSGGDANETTDVVRLVRRKTNPVDTLIVVTGMCPEPDPKDMDTNFWQFDPSNQMIFSTQEQRLIPTRQREANRIPVYASGPGSEVLNEVETLWNVPVAIKNVTLHDYVDKTNSAANKKNDHFYGYNAEDKKLPSLNPFEFHTMDSGVSTQDHHPNNSSNEAASKPSALAAARFPTKHREARRNTGWGRLSAQHVREKMAAAVSENMYGGDEGEAPVPPSWFDDDYNNEIRHDEMLALAQRQKASAAEKVKEEGEGEDNKEEGGKRGSVGDAAGSESVGACVLVTCAMIATVRLF